MFKGTDQSPARSALKVMQADPLLQEALADQSRIARFVRYQCVAARLTAPHPPSTKAEFRFLRPL